MIYTSLVLLPSLAVILAQPLLEPSGCPEPYGVQTYPHPQLCDQFYKCTNGSLTLEQCENGLLYDGNGNIHNHCNYYWGVDCGNRKADLVPINNGPCEFKYGLYAESAACSTNYLKCAEGYPYLEPCEPGLAYDDRTHKCNWPDELLDIGCNSEAIIGFKCPESVDPHSVAAKFWPYPRFPVPGDKGRLITCVNGYPRLITCGDGKLFDEASLTCLGPEDYKK
ncbi:hypothetical protein WDU94_009640 [Cyamophila willieti]